MSRLTRLGIIVIGLVVIEGFRLVTQADLKGLDGSIQNDGYAISGGLLILVGGICLGYIFARYGHRRNAKPAPESKQR